MEGVKKPMLIGLGFGLLFSSLAYLGNFPLDGTVILLIPLASTLLSGLAVVVAGLVGSSLKARGLRDTPVMIISFAAAALVNTALVILFISFLGNVVFQQEFVLAAVLALGIGAGYTVYRYRVDTMGERMAFLEALADKNRQLQEASRKLAITGERNRMSRELHDSISQGLHGLVFSLHSLRQELGNPPPRVNDILSHMEAATNSTLDELRTMIEELKPSLLAEKGLKEALEIMVELFSQRQRIPVDMELELPETLSPQLETTIYRITQEALTNIERHARAQHVYLEIAREGDHLTLSIRDDGKGFARKKAGQGSGLSNMAQRAEEAGGTLKVSSKPGAGTTIKGRFTLKG